MDFKFTKRNQISVFQKFGDLRLDEINTALEGWPEGQRGKMAITKESKPKSPQQLGWYFGKKEDSGILENALECFKENGEMNTEITCRSRSVKLPLCKETVDLFLKTSYGGWKGEYKDKGDMDMAEFSAFENWCVTWLGQWFNCHIPDPDPTKRTERNRT